MFVIMKINGRETLVFLQPEAVQIDPELIQALRESAEQRAHCRECQFHHRICVTYQAYMAVMARDN